jgi:ELWxxDGT repeat protein
MKTTRQSATFRFARQACALLFAAAGALAQTPAPILIDVNTGNGPVLGSDPNGFARLTATKSVFSAYDPVHGRELWITDGTVAGTQFLFDICPGACSGTPIPLNRDSAVALGVLYISADDGAHGRELWKVTSAGAVSLVKDINPGAEGSNPGSITFLASAQTTGYFAATSIATGNELWKTNGTSAGTVLVKDINPGAASSFPSNLGAGLDRLYFSASVPDTGRELYMSDGSPAGTVLRADINAGPGDSNPSQFVEFLNDTMLFSANDGVNGTELWITTPTATSLLKDIAPAGLSSSPSGLIGFAGKTFFFADPTGSSGNVQLWTSDGTPGGTLPFKDLCNGCNDDPRRPALLETAAGERLLFYANSVANSTPRLFVSDGTVAGTVPIFNPGAVNPLNFVISGSVAYFRDTTDAKLFRTDGTAAGSFVVHNFADEPFASSGSSSGPVGTNRIVIAADDGFIGNELYVDGPNATAPTLLKNIAPDLGYSDPQDLTDVAGTLYFSAFSETTGRELWKVADPNSGAVLVADLFPGPGDSNPTALTAFNGKLLFAANTSAGNGYPELYITDGSAQGTHPLKNLGPGVRLEYMSCMTVVGDRLYFNADGSDGNGFGVWISDGTDAGTVDIHPSTIGYGFCTLGEPGFAKAGTKVLFQASDSTHSYELFRTDGTLAGTALVRDLVPGPDSADSSAPTNFISLGALACFSVAQGGDFGNDDVEPWCSDGTAQGTVPLGDLNPGTDSSQPTSWTRVGNYALFGALSPTLGRRIWRSDGTSVGTTAFTTVASGTSVVRELEPALSGGGSPYPPPLQHDGNVIYFPCTSGAGLLCTQDIRPGLESAGSGLFGLGGGALIDQLRVFPGGDALMACWTAAAGRELCRFNSAFDLVTKPALEAAIVDIAPGAASSSPEQITPAGAYIYFTADDGTRGRELWAVALKDTIDRLFHDGFD